MLCFCTCVSLFPSLLAPFVWWDPDSVHMSLPLGSPPYCHLWLQLLEMILSFNIHFKYIRLQSKRRREVCYVCPVSPGVLGRTWSWGLTIFWSSLALSFCQISHLLQLLSSLHWPPKHNPHWHSPQRSSKCHWHRLPCPADIYSMEEVLLITGDYIMEQNGQ